MSELAPAVLLLRRAGQVFALNARSVRGVQPSPVVARVPGAPASVLGLVAWRGVVIALVEPAGGSELLGSDSPTAAILVEASAGGELLALAADEVPGFARETPELPSLSLSELAASLRARARPPTDPPRSDEEEEL